MKWCRNWFVISFRFCFMDWWLVSSLAKSCTRLELHFLRWSQTGQTFQRTFSGTSSTKLFCSSCLNYQILHQMNWCDCQIIFIVDIGRIAKSTVFNILARLSKYFYRTKKKVQIHCKSSIQKFCSYACSLQTNATTLSYIVSVICCPPLFRSFGAWTKCNTESLNDSTCSSIIW